MRLYTGLSRLVLNELLHLFLDWLLEISYKDSKGAHICRGFCHMSYMWLCVIMHVRTLKLNLSIAVKVNNT